MESTREPRLGVDYAYVEHLDAYRCAYCGRMIYPPNDDLMKRHIRRAHPEKLLIPGEKVV